MRTRQDELTLEEMLSDPIVLLLMRSDGLNPDDVRAALEMAEKTQRSRMAGIRDRRQAGQKVVTIRFGEKPSAPRS
ncbi:hypothetical protein [Mesorhizobium shangrilense]|uniref:Uncharacterized protein n=1 Tax=Mesorhizobium shangrilense TaxID=460060 RepID=A0ABV2D606_9HYPH